MGIATEAGKASQAIMNSGSSKTDFDGFSFGRFFVGFLLASTLAALVLLVPALRAASLPADATGAMLVAFAPTKSDASAFAAIHSAGGFAVRKTEWGNIWVIQAPRVGFVEAVGKQGAVGVYRDLPIGIVLAGCSGVIASLQP